MKAMDEIPDEIWGPCSQMLDLILDSESLEDLCENFVFADFLDSQCHGAFLFSVNHESDLILEAHYGQRHHLLEDKILGWDDHPVIHALRARKNNYGIFANKGVLAVPLINMKKPVACLVLLFDGSNEVNPMPDTLCKVLSKAAGFFFGVKPIQQKRRIRTVDQQVSARQRSILKMIGERFTNAQIGRELNLSESTVRQETIKIYSLLNADGRVDAVDKARTHGWI